MLMNCSMPLRRTWSACCRASSQVIGVPASSRPMLRGDDQRFQSRSMALRCILRAAWLLRLKYSLEWATISTLYNERCDLVCSFFLPCTARQIFNQVQNKFAFTQLFINFSDIIGYFFSLIKCNLRFVFVGSDLRLIVFVQNKGSLQGASPPKFPFPPHVKGS